MADTPAPGTSTRNLVLTPIGWVPAKDAPANVTVIDLSDIPAGPLDPFGMSELT